jgi:hypothetical protein
MKPDPFLAETVRVERLQNANLIAVHVQDESGNAYAIFHLAPEHAYQIARDLTRAAAYGLEKMQREESNIGGERER